MSRPVTFKIEVSGDGKTAQIKLPDGKGQQRDAQEVAKLTETLATKLGRVAERHVGRWDQHTGEHTHDHEHDTVGDGGAA